MPARALLFALTLLMICEILFHAISQRSASPLLESAERAPGRRVETRTGARTQDRVEERRDPRAALPRN